MVENVRVGRRVFQRQALYLGELNDSQREELRRYDEMILWGQILWGQTPPGIITPTGDCPLIAWALRKGTVPKTAFTISLRLDSLAYPILLR